MKELVIRVFVTWFFAAPRTVACQAPLCTWNSLGKNTGVDSHSLLQEIFPTQGSNPGLPHFRQILYSLSHQGSPTHHQYWRYKRCSFNPWVGKILWRRAWQPTLVYLPGESHGQRIWLKRLSMHTLKVIKLRPYLVRREISFWCHSKQGPCDDAVRRGPSTARKSYHQTLNPVKTLTLDFPSSRTVKKKFLSF